MKVYVTENFTNSGWKIQVSKLYNKRDTWEDNNLHSEHYQTNTLEWLQPLPNVKFLQIWQKFTFLHISCVDKSAIPLHVEKFSDYSTSVMY